MRRVSVGVGGLLFGICLGLGSVRAAPTPGDETATHSAVFHYQVHVGGILSGSVDVRASYGDHAYRVTADTRSRGPVDLIIHFRSHAVTEGKMSDAHPMPERHRADNLWMGDTRWVRMSYGTSPAPEDKVFPTAKDDDRTVVPEKAREGTIDPITATYAMMLAAGQPEHCRSMIKVFDGRRRYNLVGTYEGIHTLRAHMFDGKAEQCAYEIVQLGGRQRHPWWPKKKDPKAAQFYFARLDPRLPPVGVRVAASAGFIPVRIELTGLSVDGKKIAPRKADETAH